MIISAHLGTIKFQDKCMGGLRLVRVLEKRFHILSFFVM